MCFAPQRRALFRHFFDIWTSKSGPRPSVFNTFDFEMCFAPQRRALFQHLNFQKWSDHGVFCTFSLGNVLRATTACTFSTSQLPKVVRTWCVLYIFTWKCASRHNGVQFFISHLASWLRTRRFSEPTFRTIGATNHWKNTVFRDFPTFSRICIFFLLILSLLTLLTSAFQLSILSEVSLLNFLRLFHITFAPKNGSLINLMQQKCACPPTKTYSNRLPMMFIGFPLDIHWCPLMSIDFSIDFCIDVHENSSSTRHLKPVRPWSSHIFTFYTSPDQSTPILGVPARLRFDILDLSDGVGKELWCPKDKESMCENKRDITRL